MKNTPQVLILSGMGINCENETAFAFNQAGAKSKIIHINDLIKNPKQLQSFQILTFPGGFSYGDHTGAGKSLANTLKYSIYDELLDFINRDTLTLGFCNGFQVLISLGFLPAINNKYTKPQTALLKNNSNNYQCEWIRIKNNKPDSFWTKGIDEIDIPIAHGEGRFFIKSEELQLLKNNNQIVWKYINNPNGSIDDIAGICDPSERILGMMPHPERSLFFTNHPLWTTKRVKFESKKESIPIKGIGQQIYNNAVDYFI